MKWIKASDHQIIDQVKSILVEIDKYPGDDEIGYTIIGVLAEALDRLDETPIDLDAHAIQIILHFIEWLEANHGIEMHDMIVQDYMRYGIYRSASGIDNYLDELIKASADTWKDVDVQKYLDMVKGREENE